MTQFQPISSMTGYACEQSINHAGTLTLELRSVNSKYLDLYFRLSDDLRHVEPLLREQLGQALSRGKVECKLVWSKHTLNQTLPPLNLKFVQQLAQVQATIQQLVPHLKPLTTSEIIHWPGVFEDNNLSAEELQTEVSKLCQHSIVQLQHNRYREGAALAQTLHDKIELMKNILAALEPQLPTFIQEYEKKVRDKITDSLQQTISEQELRASINDLQQRIQLEIAAYGVRIDIREEIDRLHAHFKEINRALKQGGPVGKRLDFICQELNREANTLASKAHALIQTNSAIDLKVLIEQCREQVQNIE